MKPIDNWGHHFWHLWSIRVAAAVGILVSGIMGHVSELASLLSNLDQPWRTLLSVGVGAIAFLAPAAARLVAQPNLPPCPEKTDAPADPATN